MLIGDIETKWLGFKKVLLDLVVNLLPLARPKRSLAKPLSSRHIFVKQTQKKKQFIHFLLTHSQEH